MKLTRREAIQRFFFLGLMLAATLQAAESIPEELRQIKERMKKRLPLIEKLKKAGKVGENNRGYLHPMVKLSKKELELVKQENADRKYVYTYLAKKVHVPVEKVEKLRAEQIRKRAAPGIWLQAPDGKWYKKPPKK